MIAVSSIFRIFALETWVSNVQITTIYEDKVNTKWLKIKKNSLLLQKIRLTMNVFANFFLYLHSRSLRSANILKKRLALFRLGIWTIHRTKGSELTFSTLLDICVSMCHTGCESFPVFIVRQSRASQRIWREAHTSFCCD